MDSDSDDSDGFFKAKHRVPFGGKRPSLSTSMSSCDEDDSDDDVASSKKRTSPTKKSKIADIRKTLARTRWNCDSDSDSDDDIQIVGCTSTTRNSTRSKRPTATAPPRQVTTISIDDSSSDEEGSGTATRASITATSRSAVKALQRARMAQYNLSSAHNFRAADVRVDVPTRPSTAVRETQPIIKPSVDYGPTMRLKLRTTELVAGAATGTIREDYMNIGTREPLRKLVDRYRQAKALDGNSRVMFFRGDDRLNLTKTPDALGFRDNEVIRVEAPPPKNLPHKVSPTAAEAKADLGNRISLCLRVSTGKQVIVVTRTKAPLSKVVEKFKKQRGDIGVNARVDLFFDGETMNLSTTPESHDLEDEDLIDVKIR